jgi:LCP family protein required for cell wall assembly
MTGSDDDALGGEPALRDGSTTPFSRSASSPDSPLRDAPGPRPGHYPSSAGTAGTAELPASGERPAPSRSAPDSPAGSRPQSASRSRHTGMRRRPAPAPAQQQLMARISAGRKARQRRALLMAAGAMSALVMLTSGGAWALTSYINGHLGRLNAGTAGTPSSGPLNIVVAGLDERTGLTQRQQAQLHVGANSGETDTDTLMVVHVPANHRYVRVVSLPRDSWVNIPGHGTNKINAALGLGGPSLMVQTIEQLTGLTINDYVEVNFLGFVKVIDALGGVNICLPFAVDDRYSGLHMSAGMHRVNGITALEFARDRHSFATSDLARIQDQQQLISSALSEGLRSGVLANPVRLESFLSATSAAIRVDQGFNVVSLADELRGLSPSDVTFTTVPLANINYQTPTGQSAVLWNQSAAAALFNEMKTDQAPASQAPAAGHKAAKRHAPRRGQVSVDVYNGTTISGLSGSTGSQLAALGFKVHRSGVDWPNQNLTQTVIQYPAGQKAQAQVVRQVLPGAQLQQVKGLARVRILLGQNDHTVTASAPDGQNTSGTSGSSGTSSQSGQPSQQRTAAQDACH